MEIVELRSEIELREAFPVMRELRTHLDEARYLALLRVMMPRGYRLLAVRDSGRIVALAGIEVMTNLYNDRHVWVYDLVTTAGERSRGHGRRLLTHVEQLGRSEGCTMIALSSGLQRLDAHRFYERHMGFEPVSYSFNKRLSSASASGDG
jgi:GNAT superfamily N-acetyltransferase